MEEITKPVIVWNPPESAWMPTKRGIRRHVWIHHITECGRYAVVSYTQGSKHIQVLVSNLRKERNR
jgi:hypothetical protein